MCWESGSNEKMLVAGSFLEMIQSIPRLTAEQEKDLARLAKNGNMDARNQLILANLDFVVKVARKYMNGSLSLDELIAEGNIGLIHAVEKYDFKRENRFQSFAVWWIRMAMIDAMVHSRSIVRSPGHIVKWVRNWKSASLELQRKYNRKPSFSDVAQAIDLPPDMEMVIWRALKPDLVYPMGGDEEENNDFLNPEIIFQSEKARSPEMLLIEKSEREMVYKLLERLGPIRAAILKLRYGLEGDTPLAPKAVALKLNLPVSRVKKLEAMALRSLLCVIK